MPLTDYQHELALLLAENRTFDSYLAGGAAILIEPNTMRFSRDLDYYHDSEARVSEAFSVDQRLLLGRGYSVEVELSQPGSVRAIVRRGDDATKDEWARDSDWRFMPTVRDARVGFVLHPVGCTGNACKPPPVCLVGVEQCGIFFSNAPVKTFWNSQDAEPGE